MPRPKQTYDEWMVKVDRELEKVAGLPHDHFPDWNWMDAFEAGTSTSDAIQEFLEEQGFDSLLEVEE